MPCNSEYLNPTNREQELQSKFMGYGLTGLAGSEAMFPQGHEVQTLDNGWKGGVKL